jgi:hypothetical protein
VGTAAHPKLAAGVKFKDGSEDMQETSQKMQNLQSTLPAESEYHGWIWLFLRQPPEKTVAR